MRTRDPAFTVRWIARVCSLLSLAVLLLFIVGEFSSKGPGPTPDEWVGLAFFPIGVVLGLIVGWRFEITGGAIAMGALVAFYWWNVSRWGSYPRGPFFFLFSAPGLLFLLAGYVSRHPTAGDV
jgi:hypothetical protein